MMWHYKNQNNNKKRHFAAKRTITREKRKPIKQKISATYPCYMKLISTNYEEFKNSKHQVTYDPVNIRANEPYRLFFPGEKFQIAINRLFKMWCLSHERNANQIYFEIPSHPTQNGNHQENRTQMLLRIQGKVRA